MSIYKNAIDSIVMGLEDFQHGDERRVIAATRNLYAGILLLLKSKLSDLSPEDSNNVLIKRRMIPQKDKDGNIQFVGDGKETVNRKELKERCEGLDIKVDWKGLDKVAKYRNDIEHYFPQVSAKTAKQMLSRCFVIIRDFLKEELGKDPIIELGTEQWGFLLEQHDVFTREREACCQAMASLVIESSTLKDAFVSFECGACGSALMRPDSIEDDLHYISFTCQSCGQKYDFEDAVEIALESKFWYEEYTVHTEGGEPPVVDCPGCGKHAYVIEEGKCMVCDESYPSNCQVCGESIATNDFNELGICGYCAYKMEKSEKW